ncbi:MAG: hypothetical protein EOL95_02145 [Bacteroidia bacterium]|nr:hypothetical protein [Bacteroidia bacterium]
MRLKSLLITPLISISSINAQEFTEWSTTSYESGITPDCSQVSPEYADSINNFLKIKVGANTDVIVRLMRISEPKDVCIRSVYVRSNESYEMRQIPEDVYYIKIAYGKDYREKNDSTGCFGKFFTNEKFEKGKDLLDFTRAKQADRIIDGKKHEVWHLPTYEIFLDASEFTPDDKKTMNNNSISEREFNK